MIVACCMYGMPLQLYVAVQISADLQDAELTAGSTVGYRGLRRLQECVLVGQIQICSLHQALCRQNLSLGLSCLVQTDWDERHEPLTCEHVI